MRRPWLIRYPTEPRESRVVLRRGAFRSLGSLVRATAAPPRAVIVTDRRVGALYARTALRSLERAGISSTIVTIPVGERSKSLVRLEGLWRAFARFDLDRRAAVIALGGGVVGDLAGFAAATWLRGVAWIGVPTSLVAQVDSSVGGKTAIDLDFGKNLAGSFHQPALALVDPNLLSTLPPRHVAAGLAEVVKIAMVADARLFAWIEAHAARLIEGDARALETAIGRALRAKARVVIRDEREREGGARTALNFGHTLGHAIEAALGYRGLLHGEAVAIGMRVAARLSVRCDGFRAESQARLERVLDQWRLPRRMPPTSIDVLFRAMSRDKKRRDASTRWVLTPRVGHASVPRLIPREMVEEALLEAGARISRSRGRSRS